MKKTIGSILILITIVSFSYLQKSKSVLVDLNENTNFRIKGISLTDLNTPGLDFEKIKPLGEPLDTKYKKSFVDETWLYSYSGFTLLYIDINGYPELREMIINEISDELNIAFREKEIRKSMKYTALFDINSNSPERIKGTIINQDIPELEKFQKTYSYMEVLLDSNNQKIKKIVYKRKY